MAEIVLTRAMFKIGATSAALTSLTTFCKSVSITYQAEILDKTAMGSSGRKRIAGLKDGSVRATFNQDYVAAKVDATLWPYIGTTGCFIKIQALTSKSTTINPRFVGAFHLPSYSPIDGAVGALNEVSVDFQGHGVISRLVTAT